MSARPHRLVLSVDLDWRSALFYRHAGTWMLDAVDRLLTTFRGRVMPGREAAGA